MISFIVPAHNEELWIGKCLGSIRTAMDRVAERYEVIVVDDASTDSGSSTFLMGMSGELGFSGWQP